MSFGNYLTIIEAAKILKIRPNSLQRLCRQGDIPATRLHNTWLLEKDELEIFAKTYNPKRGGKKKLLRR